MKLIVTRPAPDSEAFAALAAQAGFDPVISPVMSIKFQDAPTSVAPDEAIAFTSANGVRAFARLNPHRTAGVYAVGAATANAARLAGFTDIMVAKGDVESLAELIAETKRHKRIVHLAGSDRAGNLAAALDLLGVETRRVVLYLALPATRLSAAAEAVLSTEAETVGVALFSPRSARLFLGQAKASGVLTALRRAAALCLSRSVANEASNAVWRRVVITDNPSADAMIDLAKEIAKRP
jgi:uroporphyrinogen-III synthase